MATTTGLINQQWIIRDYFGQQSRLSTTKPFWNVDHLTTFRGGCVFSYLHAAQRNSRLEVSWVTAQMFRSKSLQRKYCKVRNLVVTIRAGKSWMNTRSFYNFSWKWSKVNKDNYALAWEFDLFWRKNHYYLRNFMTDTPMKLIFFLNGSIMAASIYRILTLI